MLTRSVLFLLAVGFSLTWVRIGSAQSDPCALSTVLSSFEAAALSNNVDQWLGQYRESECPNKIKQGAQQLARGFSTLSETSFIANTPASGFDLLPDPSNPLHLNPALEWVQGHSLDNEYLFDPISGTLTLMAVRGSGIWERINNVPMLRYPVSGNFEASVRINHDPQGDAFKVAGIAVISGSNDRTFYKLDRSLWEKNEQGIGSNFLRDGSLQGNLSKGTPYNDPTIYFRIIRNDTIFTSFYSHAGEEWTVLADKVQFPMPSDVYVALFVESYAPQAAVAHFSDFSVNHLGD